MLERLCIELNAGRALTPEQVSAAVAALVREDVPAAVKADFLSRLSRKGETVEEIICFVREMRSRSVQPVIEPALRAGEILDVVGTGGDRLSTFNISSTVAFIAAAAGVLVAKHGNRASTSTIGSADVMDALGVRFDQGPDEAVASLRQHGFTFFFAPRYHPAFKHIIPARKLCAAQGQSTVFNFLGPLLNPGNPSAMLVGVPRPELCEAFAKVLQMVGVRRAMVVCGAIKDETGTTRYLDEFSPQGPTTVAEFYQDKGLTCSQFSPELLPLGPGKLADLRGGDREVNANIIWHILRGEERGPKRDAVLINAAAALFVAGRARTLIDGWQVAAETINSGRAARKLAELTQRQPV